MEQINNTTEGITNNNNVTDKPKKTISIYWEKKISIWKNERRQKKENWRYEK